MYVCIDDGSAGRPLISVHDSLTLLSDLDISVIADLMTKDR